jgi:hypothetical protein
MTRNADAELRARVLDAVYAFFAAINSAPDQPRTSRDLFEMFADALVRILLPCSFHLFWEDRRALHVAARQDRRSRNASYGWPPGPPARLVAGSVTAYAPFEIQHYTRDGTIVAVSFTRSASQRLLCMALDDENPHDVALLLLRSVRDLQLLYSSLQAVVDAAIVAAAERERTFAVLGRLASVTQDRTLELPLRVREVARILGEGAVDVDVAREASVWLLQELLGAGWPTRLDMAGDAPPLRRSIVDLRQRRRQAETADAPVPRDATLAAALATLDALLEDEPGSAVTRTATLRGPRPRSSGEYKQLLAALAPWTREHLRFQRLAESASHAQPHDASLRIDAAARRVLWRYVEHEQERHPRTRPARRRAVGGGAPGRAAAPAEGRASPRVVAALDFCLRALDSMETTLSPRDDIPSGAVRVEAEVSAALAFVVRECVRFLCFGRRPDFLVQPAVYADALAHVVHWHAEAVLGLSPRYEVGELLTRLGCREGLNRGQHPLHHLLHVLDAYICTDWLLSLSLADKNGSDHSLADVLAGGESARHGSIQGQTLRRATALAVLFHDVGQLLFPSSARPATTLARGNATLVGAFAKLETKVAESATALVEPAVDVLSRPPYCTPDNEARLARWLDLQRSAAHPARALLSAYYLHHVCSRVAGDSVDLQRQAVRAVLLSNALEVEIDARSDPAASLLIAANELFEWDPERSLAPAPSAVGRTFHLTAADVSGLELRAHSFGFNLEQGSDPAGPPRTSLCPDPPDGWPVIDVHLQFPQRLDVPIYHLWLLKAQSLGRIRPGALGWSPRLRLHARADRRLPADMPMCRVLDHVTARLPSPLRGALEEWLRRLRSSRDGHVCDHAGDEIVTLGPETAFAPDVDLNACLFILDREVDAFLLRERR